MRRPVRRRRKLRWSVLLHPLEVLRDRVDSSRTVGVAAAFDRRADRTTTFHADAPLIDRNTVRNALVTIAGHRQPGVGETPSERRVLLAIVHMAVDLDPVDFL